jgi:hypothetical protein
MSGKERIKQLYETVMRLPVPVILAMLWLGAMVLLGLCVLIIYLYVSALVEMLLGP